MVKGSTIRLRPHVPFRMRQAKECLPRDGKVFRIRQYLDSGFMQACSPELVAYIFEGTELSKYAPAN